MHWEASGSSLHVYMHICVFPGSGSGARAQGAAAVTWPGHACVRPAWAGIAGLLILTRNLI